ncbi:hypothetical protein [uncultured Methanobrevibacter sp.]|uniref:hypothetical protein n=1 Tax=uncultured Methanobrevibacter sp. TaxID=253161 RepID=UPI002620FEF7|nr:hypothetical protein [uncultured Methanobrevibacter sp.]
MSDRPYFHQHCPFAELLPRLFEKKIDGVFKTNSMLFYFFYFFIWLSVKSNSI